MTESQRREEALRSALGRLPLAVFVVDDRRVIRPLNAKASRLMETEGFHGDLIDARPSHPLTKLILGILGTDIPVEKSELLFPRGSRYSVEPSRRSEKGLERWLILLLDEVHEKRIDIDAMLDNWGLTAREREVALHMTQGASSRTICKTMQIAPTTFKTHVAHILRKSGTQTRTEFLTRFLVNNREA